MIKFFRNIRQHMIKENKVSKYLLYAIGEIVLVVIGILIALQINNNNEEKQRIKKEYEIMTNLAEDFKNNIANLTTSIDSLYPDWAIRLNKNISHFGLKNDQITDDIKSDLRWTGYYTTKIIDGSLNSILSSEKLELLRDTKLKNMLTTYPASIADFKFHEDNLVRYVRDDQRVIFRQYVSLADNSYVDSIIRQNAAQSDYEGLIGNLYYQNTILGNSFGLVNLRREANYLKLASEEIYNQLLDNINKNPNHISNDD